MSDPDDREISHCNCTNFWLIVKLKSKMFGFDFVSLNIIFIRLTGFSSFQGFYVAKPFGVLLID